MRVRRSPSLILAASWAFLIILLAVSIVWALTRPIPSASLAASEIVYVGLMVAMLTALGVAALRTRDIERRFWTVFLAATALVFVGDAYWSWYVVAVDARGPAMPAWFQLPQAMGAFLFLAIPVNLTQVAAQPFATRLRAYLDLLIVITIGTAIFYVAWMYHLFEGVANATIGASVIAAIYPAYATVVLGLALFVLFRPDAAGQRTWTRLVAFALILYALGLYLWPGWYAGLLAADGQVATGGEFALAAALGYCVVVMAVVYRMAEGSRAAELVLRPTPRFARRYGVFFAPLAALFVPVLGVYAYVSGRLGDEIEAAIIGSIGVVLALLLVARSWLSALELTRERTRVLSDPLTGAGTVTALRTRLERRLLEARRAGQGAGIATFDVDGFDRVNDVHGHDAGDDVLRQVAATVKALGGPGSETFRSGSDEFTLMMPSASLDDYASVAERIVRAVDGSVTVAGFPVTVSAGVAAFPEHGADADELLGAAWSALLRASERSPGTMSVFDPASTSASDPEVRLRQMRRQTQVAAIRALASILESRDRSLQGHSEGVSHLAERLGEILGLEADTIRRLAFAGLVHDVGKVALPDELATRRARPDEPDSEPLTRHTVTGARILASAGLTDVASWVRHHHERWDGRGYPDRLEGEEIPLGSRILAVCDAFEILTSGTPGRAIMSRDAAIQELDQAMGSRFDPSVTEAFIRMIGSMRIADAPAVIKEATSSKTA